MKSISFKNPGSHSTLCLAVTGYEFPKITEEHDANWLMVHVDVTFKDQRFQNASPCLLASDLLDIAFWFDQLFFGKLPGWICNGFIEPNLEFEVYRSTDAIVRFGIRLSHESKPPFEISRKDDTSETCVFELTYPELAEVAASFRLIADQFPTRHFDKRTVAKIRKYSEHFQGQLRRRFN